MTSICKHSLPRDPDARELDLTPCECCWCTRARETRLRPEPPFPKYWIDVAAERLERWFEYMELQP